MKSTNTTDARRVLMIGLDAAEFRLVERWMADGGLPNLRVLLEAGAHTRLRSSAEWLVGSPWPTFYTGLPPSEHGLYHYLIWRPEKMASERPSATWLPVQPFWRDIAAERRVIALDIPIAYAPEPFPGMEVAGWATHETLEPPASYPPELLQRIRKRFGAPPFDDEQAHLLNARELLTVRDQCVRTTELVGNLSLDMLRGEPWDLFMVCFGALHRAGHQLWDLTSMSGSASREQRSELRDALRQVYTACDHEIGRLVAEAGPSTTVLVFSLHGMGPNASRADLLREMLARVLAGGDEPPTPRLAERLRRLAPIRMRSWIKSRLPWSLQDRLSLFWRTGGIEWKRTLAFAAFCDLDGYVRLNVAGRERDGIVAPGAEYDQLCARIEAGLSTFVDADTGAPIIQRIGRATDIWPVGRHRDRLPDLVVKWSSNQAAHHRAITSSNFGSIPWPSPGHHPQGRSGNHLPDGFLVASGTGIARGCRLEHRDIVDLAPTVYRLLGLPVPHRMQGKPLFTDSEAAR